jgi:hypothetical protein
LNVFVGLVEICFVMACGESGCFFVRHYFLTITLHQDSQNPAQRNCALRRMSVQDVLSAPELPLHILTEIIYSTLGETNLTTRCTPASIAINVSDTATF